MLTHRELLTTPGIIIYVPSGLGRWIDTGKSLWMWNTNGKSLLTPNICLLVWVDGARRSGQTFIISHLSATFRAVWRKRAWSFSFRLCSACVMRALERSRHWRQLAICCANLRSFITCKRRSTGQKVSPSAGFSSVCSLKAANIRLPGPLHISLRSREQWHENKHRDSTGILDRMLWMLIKKTACQRNPVRVCEHNYISEAESRRNKKNKTNPELTVTLVWVTYSPSCKCPDNNHLQLTRWPSNISNMQSMKFQMRLAAKALSHRVNLIYLVWVR